MNMAALTGRRIDEPELDVAAMRIGTIDDLAHQALIELQLGALIDGVVQRGLMRQAVFEGTGYFRRNGRRRALVQGYLNRMFNKCRERLEHSRLCCRAPRPPWPGSRRHRAVGVLGRWCGTDVRDRRALSQESLDERGQMDFVLLEERFLAELRSGGLETWLTPTRVLLVDEYQDTNLQKESIYIRIVEHILREGGWFAIVGDDEQACTASAARRLNFLSTHHSGSDSAQDCESEHQPSLEQADPQVRQPFCHRGWCVSGREAPKRPLRAARDRRAWTASDRLPVVGLFRPDVATLAQDMTAAIEALLGAGWKLPGGRLAVSQPGDIAVLAPTTAAITESWQDDQTCIRGTRRQLRRREDRVVQSSRHATRRRALRAATARSRSGVHRPRRAVPTELRLDVRGWVT